ncbi:MAG TPA: hypothetical protein VIM42_09145 [Clostridium sp.]
MFFITGIEQLNVDYGVTDSRCFGYKETFKEADQSVRENCCDINETIYDYAVIEYIESGLHQTCLAKRWFYMFNYIFGIYERIEEPEEVKGLCNFSIG